MPLNHDLGGPSPDIVGPFRVVPVSKWYDTEFFPVACENAAKAALVPIRFSESDILMQEYPQANKLEFVFLRGVAGVEHFYRWVFDIPEALIGDLKAAGRWAHEAVN